MMKAFFDRSSHFIHCRRLLGKFVAGAVTSGSGHDSDVLDYMKYYAQTCSAQFTGGVSSRASNIKEKMQDAFQLGKNLISDIREKKEYPEQMQVIARHAKHFRNVMELMKNEWVNEYQYWKERNWL
ncbi:MAG: iron-sulfur protein, partial [Candidatus Aureabacteria bacterium]|nr:iron-sulfur protein [Candidatus Auribacterota bacterium]